MDQVWQIIKRDVVNHNWKNIYKLADIGEFFKTQFDVFLAKYPINIVSNSDSFFGRHGDIFVGFYLDDTCTLPISLQLTLGGVPLPDLDIKPGEVVYVFENTHVFPMISVTYNELRATTSCYDGLYAIYAFIGDHKLRTAFPTNTNILQFESGKTAVIYDNFHYVDVLPDKTDAQIDIPNMNLIAI